MLRLSLLFCLVTRQPLDQLELAEFIFAFRATVLYPNVAFKPRRVTSMISLPCVEIEGGL